MDIDTIRSALQKPGKSKKGLAEALGRSPQVVTELLKGERALKAKEIPVVERYLELAEPDESADQPMARVVGYVGAGAEAHFYAVSQGDLDEVPAPLGSTENTVAVEIRGESLGKTWERALVFYDDVRSPVTPDLVGRLCVIGLESGQILVKRIFRSRQKGRFNLISDNGPDLEAVAIDWAAKVKAVVPR